MKWIVNITLPERGGVDGDTEITQEQLTEELQELCRAGYDLDDDEFTVTVAPAAEGETEQQADRAERTGTEG